MSFIFWNLFSKKAQTLQKVLIKPLDLRPGSERMLSILSPQKTPWKKSHQVESHVLEAEASKLFLSYEETWNPKCRRLCRPCGHCRNRSTLSLKQESSHRQYVHKRAWLHSKTISFTITGGFQIWPLGQSSPIPGLGNPMKQLTTNTQEKIIQESQVTQIRKLPAQ